MNKDLNKLWDDKLEGLAWQIKEEFLSLLLFIQERNIKSVLEIGCYKGGTARGFLELGCTVDSVDIQKQPEIYQLEKDFPDKFKWFKREEFPSDKTYDLLWIDGDHSYERCLKDYIEFNRLIPTGFVAFHDVVDSPHHREHGCEVYKVVDELSQLRGVNRYNFIKGEIWGGISVLHFTEER